MEVSRSDLSSSLVCAKLSNFEIARELHKRFARPRDFRRRRQTRRSGHLLAIILALNFCRGRLSAPNVPRQPAGGSRRKMAAVTFEQGNKRGSLVHGRFNPVCRVASFDSSALSRYQPPSSRMIGLYSYPIVFISRLHIRPWVSFILCVGFVIRRLREQKNDFAIYSIFCLR